jgi:acetyl-CoA carboxylase biotin carboxyl carrier protein
MSNHDAEIDALIAEFQQSDLRELHIRNAKFELYLSKESGGQVALQRSAPTSAQVHPEAAARELQPEQPVATALPPGTVPVPAPYLGTFYRAPKPGAPNYVEVGSVVQAETELCLVEVMKLFTSVRAGVSGTVEAILAADGQMVQAEQPLFAIRTA